MTAPAGRQPIKVADFRIEGKRILVKDTKDRRWERYDDMPIGVWGNIVLPEEPEPAEARRSRKGRP